MGEVVGQAEADGIHGGARGGGVGFHEAELEVALAHDAGAVGRGQQARRGKHGVGIAGAEGLELAQLGKKGVGDAAQGQGGGHVHGAHEVLGGERIGHHLLELLLESGHVLHLQGEAGGGAVAPKLVEQRGAGLQGLVHIEAGHRAGRAGGLAVALREDDGGAVVLVEAARGHDAEHALVPVGLVEHGGAGVLQALGARNHVQRLLGGVLVRAAALLVHLVHHFGGVAGLLLVGGQQHGHGAAGVAHAPGGIDAGREAKDEAADAQWAFAQRGQLAQGGQAGPQPVGFLVEAAQAVGGQDAVFAGDGHDVGRDAHGHQIEQVVEGGLVAAQVLAQGLHQLEAHATARQLLVRVPAVGPLRVEHGHGGGQVVAGQVVVADDEIDAPAGRVGHGLHGLDAAVEGHDEGEAVVGGVVDGGARDAVALGVAVGDVVVQALDAEERREVAHHERHRRDAVYVVVAKHEHLLAAA